MESLNSNSQERELHQLQQMQDEAKESCMVSFRLLHSHLKALLNNDLKRTCIEGGFERAFTVLFDQDVQTFTCSMLLNLDQPEQQLVKEEFQETRSMDAFRDNSSKALDAGLVVTKSNETKSKRHALSSRSGNDTHTDDADINSVNDKTNAEYNSLPEHNILA
ncbi:hypothetical protein Tco_0321346 [Tanacetum coccineum]